MVKKEAIKYIMDTDFIWLYCYEQSCSNWKMRKPFNQWHNGKKRFAKLIRHYWLQMLHNIIQKHCFNIIKSKLNEIQKGIPTEVWITKSFGVVSVLEGVDLKVKHGEIHALLYMNRSGAR
jgi:hypothetical protein